jgi:hypothetical protein
MPVQAGIQFYPVAWLPACAGMTAFVMVLLKLRRYFGKCLGARQKVCHWLRQCFAQPEC